MDCKPIVLFRVPDLNRYSGSPTIQESLRDQMPDYYVFVIEASHEEPEPLIQTFYEKDFTEIQYQELKDLLMGELKTNTNEQQ